MAERERSVVPERQSAREWRQARQLPDALRMAAPPLAQPDELSALSVEWLLEPMQARLALLRLARAREREPSAQFLATQVQQPALSSPALRGQRVLPRAQQVLREQLASPPQEQRSPAEAPELPRASFAQFSPRHPSLLFPPWPPLPPALLLRRRPESACALSPRRPPESNSSASSFP